MQTASAVLVNFIIHVPMQRTWCNENHATSCLYMCTMMLNIADPRHSHPAHRHACVRDRHWICLRAAWRHGCMHRHCTGCVVHRSAHGLCRLMCIGWRCLACSHAHSFNPSMRRTADGAGADVADDLWLACVAAGCEYCAGSPWRSVYLVHIHTATR